MGTSRSHCAELLGSFCSSEVDRGGLHSLEIYSSSSLWIAFIYAMMIIIMSIHTTGSPGGGRERGECKGGCINLIMIYTHILLTYLRREAQFAFKKCRATVGSCT